MASFLLDTHTWSWNLTVDPRLPGSVLHLINTADAVHVSPVSLYEIAQKVRLGRWPEMAEHANALPSLLQRQRGRVAALTPEVAVLAASLEWAHRDPFDRLIAATAIALKLPLLSADTAFDNLPPDIDWPGRIWR